MTEIAFMWLALFTLVFTSAAFGVTALLSYLVLRMIRADNWDHSNMTNALRVLSHVIMHPEDLAFMYYTETIAFDRVRTATRRPFWYIDQDEITQVVTARPTAEEKSL